MKVTLINTTDTGGGAPVACMRLLKALELKKVDVKLLVEHQKTTEPRVTGLVKTWLESFRAQFRLLRERLPFIFFYARDNSVRFAFSTADTGLNIANEPAIADADIIHLHWTNFGFLSIDSLKQLAETGKPIVWTLHDMWAFTGGCHYAGTCDHFQQQCGNCYFLRKPHGNDLSHQVWLDKLDLFLNHRNITFVTCSNWLAGVARQSSLLSSFRIQAIPNPIDTNIFTPKDKLAARKKWNVDPNGKIILFGAANIMDRRKGLNFLVEALFHLKNYSATTGNVGIVIFGKNKLFDVSLLPFPTLQLDLITSQADLVEIYSMADVTVSPSIEDNLPNIIMESLACGTPVVAFNTGGIPDLVDHEQNGYLAQFKSSADLGDGIHHVLFTADAAQMATAARKKVLDNFSNEKVADQYMDVYRSVLIHGSVQP